MKSSLKISLILLLVISLAIVSNVHADVGGACVEQAYQCNGPGGETILKQCGLKLCDVCPKDSLAFRTECMNGTSNSAYNNMTSSASFDLKAYLGDTLKTALGQASNSTYYSSSAQSRLMAIITLLMLLMILLALLAMLLQLLKYLFRKVSTVVRSISTSRASYLNPKKTRDTGNSPDGGICKFPKHNKKIS